MSRTDPQLKIRLSESLKGLVDDAAASNRRSINSEITARLESSFRPTSLFEDIGNIAAEHANAVYGEDGPALIPALNSVIARLEYQLVEHEASIATERLYAATLAIYLSRAFTLLPKNALKSLSRDETSEWGEAIEASLVTPLEDLIENAKKAKLSAEQAIKKFNNIQLRNTPPSSTTTSK